jgi:hypothetical protein
MNDFVVSELSLFSDDAASGCCLRFSGDDDDDKSAPDVDLLDLSDFIGEMAGDDFADLEVVDDGVLRVWVLLLLVTDLFGDRLLGESLDGLPEMRTVCERKR